MPSPSDQFEMSVMCEQVFNKNSLGYIWKRRNEIDPGQMAIIKALYDNRKKGSIEGSVRVEYKLGRGIIGKLGYGRLYGTRGSMETLEREIRGTLCEEFYHDIDVKNAHPVILHQFAKKNFNRDLAAVKNYCDNRDAALLRISNNRDEAKTAFLKVMYGGKCEHAHLSNYEKEVSSFSHELANHERHAELIKHLRKQDKNIYASALALVLQTEERKIMLSMKASLEKQGWSVDVLAYDGVMIRKKTELKLTDEMLRQAEKDILADTDYVVELADKAFEKYDVPANAGEVAPKVAHELYEERKEKFEENHFYFAPTNTIGETNDKGQLAFYSLEHASTLYKPFDFKHSFTDMCDRTSFIKLWLNDDRKRTHYEIDQKPSEDPNIYSPPVVFAYQRTCCHAAEEEGRYNTILSFFSELVSLAAGGDHDMELYILYWFAHILQKPFENPGTSIILTGRQGCGKDTLGDFFSEWIMGRNYSHNYTSTEQFWDRHDCERMGKFFIKIEEASGFLNRQHIGQMKAIITSHTLTVNPKGTKALTTSNYNRIFMTTNEASPIKKEQDDRRFGVSACSPKRVGDHAYWKALRAALFNEEGAAVVAKFLMGLNLEKFNPQIVPVSAYAKEVMEADKSVEDRFLEQWDGQELTASAFYRTYQSWCNENDLRYAPNAQTMGHRMLTAVRDGKLLKKRKADGMYYSK